VDIKEEYATGIRAAFLLSITTNATSIVNRENE
jgi:hypothetical protein